MIMYDEIKDIQAGVIDSFKSTDPATGHFTQVVWAATTEIGCGMSKSGDQKPLLSATYYVACNYGVGGNMLGAKIYTRGPACSQCKNGLKCNSDYPGLCGEITIASGESLSVISKFYYTLLSIAVIMLS
ncbi:hypothetical protein NQ317_018159 [Molorchus minor]|uniref:SCP domain-containing protein n=1 Tax=Molorchus minor TaxID=1323400 RepID=A0ABQ9J245_9CUCU|nr:hypothetical protein NQ317_018159 [Molorchus minor]